MVEEKYIKRAGKLHGPYYYKSVRDEKGNVKKIYLGKEKPVVIPQESQYQRKALDINFRNISITLFIFIILIGLYFLFRGFPVTGQYSLPINRLVSSNAYMEIDGVSQAIPLETIKIGEDWYYNITTLELTLPQGEHNLKIIDNSETVFDQTFIVSVSEEGGIEPQPQFSVQADAAECVNLSNSSTFQGRVTQSGNQFAVNESISLCTEIYSFALNDYDTLITLNDTGNTGNITLNCNNSILARSSGAHTTAIKFAKGGNFTVINCLIQKPSGKGGQGFGKGISMDNSEDTTNAKVTISNNSITALSDNPYLADFSITAIQLKQRVWHNSVINENTISDVQAGAGTASNLISATAININGNDVDNAYIENITVTNNNINNIYCAAPGQYCDATAISVGNTNIYNSDHKFLSTNFCNISNNVITNIVANDNGEGNSNNITASGIYVSGNNTFIFNNNISIIYSNGGYSLPVFPYSSIEIYIESAEGGNSRILNNNITDCNTDKLSNGAVNPYPSYVIIGRGKNLEISNNLISNTTLYALYFNNFTNLNINNNTLANVSIPFSITNSSNITLSNNLIYRDEYFGDSPSILTLEMMLKDCNNVALNNNIFQSYSTNIDQKFTIQNLINLTVLGNIFRGFNEKSNMMGATSNENIAIENNLFTNMTGIVIEYTANINLSFKDNTFSNINGDDSMNMRRGLIHLNYNQNVTFYNNTLVNPIYKEIINYNYSLLVTKANKLDFEPYGIDILNYNNMTNITSPIQLLAGYFFMARASNGITNLSGVTVNVYFNYNNTLNRYEEIDANINLTNLVTDSDGLTYFLGDNTKTIPEYFVANRTFTASNYSAYQILYTNNATIIANTSTKTIRFDFTVNRTYLYFPSLGLKNELYIDFGYPIVTLTASQTPVRSGSYTTSFVSVSCSASDYQMGNVTVSSASGTLCTGVSSCSATYYPSSSETVTCTAVDAVGNTAAASTPIDYIASYDEPPEPLKLPLISTIASIAQQANVFTSAGSFTLIQFPEGTMKFYYELKEGTKKPKLDLIFDTTMLQKHKTVSVLYVPPEVYAIALVALMVLICAGILINDRKEQITDYLAKLGLKKPPHLKKR